MNQHIQEIIARAKKTAQHQVQQCEMEICKLDEQIAKIQERKRPVDTGCPVAGKCIGLEQVVRC